jgi:HSP20 family protein
MLPTVFRFVRPSLADDFLKTNFWGDLLDAGNSCTTPAVNIVEKEEDFQIEVAAPGFSKDDFKVNLNNNVLTISSEKENKKEEDEKNYSRREFSYSSFTRSFTLSEHVDAEKISASYKDGILHIHLPKKEEAKAKPNREIAIA